MNHAWQTRAVAVHAPGTQDGIDLRARFDDDIAGVIHLVAAITAAHDQFIRDLAVVE
ncbi:hypothetical protein ACFSTJ_14195 [Ottowia pentelensis]|uniref:hypothetical protein n=1 Tax=Ottowia pentelensis TaxID=511108 RepID=UPI0036407010